MEKRYLKKLLVLFAVFVVGFCIFLFVANYRYSFYTPHGGGWSVGFRYIENPLKKIEPLNSQVLDLEWLNTKTDQETRFLADPFVIHERDTFYVFFEHQAMGNANIALLQSPDGIKFTYMGEVLDESFHLSFPNVFKYREEFFMLPETKQAGHILLYKAKNFPYNWEVYDTLIANVKLKDPVLLLTDSLKIISATDEHLTQHLFTSESLEGPWFEDENFEKRRGDRTRAGGNFFEINDNWYVPFQKNNNGYGSGLALYQLKVEGNQKKFEKVLDPYLEKSDSIIWFNRGMHHLSLINLGDRFFAVYDGDVEDSLTPKQASWKASLKFNYYDFMKYFQ